MKHITKVVWILSIISLLTDAASEMLYPIMPIYLQKIGFSVFLIGILEGVAEAVAGLSKGYFGKLSDSMNRRVHFVQVGYAFSAISKPMMVFFIYPIWIFFARTIDRFGKGIRTGARDALLSNESTPETKGRIFGFHRSMDTFGAVIGPLFALLFLYYYPDNFKTLFLLAFIPGLLAIISSFFLKESNVKNFAQRKQLINFNFFSFLKYWKASPVEYRKIVTGFLIFTLFNSSDVFLLLKIKESGFSDTFVIGVYIFYNLVFALFSFPLGILADKIGLKKIYVFGLLIFAVVYFGMAINTNLYIYFILFLLYGIYASATEGVSKAWISNISQKEDVATAIGTYTAFQSIGSMLASSITGLVWFKFGGNVAFSITSFMTVCVVIYFLNIPKLNTQK
jgi:MFS family permease